MASAVRGGRRAGTGGGFAPAQARSAAPGGVLFAAVLLTPCGCGRDARLAGQALPTDLTVRAVTHYGVTLDEKASPEEAGYVLLRALREDFEAKDAESRQRAMGVQYDVAAVNDLLALNPAELPAAEAIYGLVRSWAATVGHYAAQLPAEWETARDRLRVTAAQASKTGRAGVQECQLLYPVADPKGDARAGAILFVSLVQEQGMWRVRSVGFVPGRRALSRSGDDGEARPGQPDES